MAKQLENADWVSWDLGPKYFGDSKALKNCDPKSWLKVSAPDFASNLYPELRLIVFF